jgi:drug/metabolite transporter (DMT)-like permease
MPSSSRRTAYLLLLNTVFLWGIAPLAVKFLSKYYSVWTQNGFRFACAAAMLLAWHFVQGYRPFRNKIQNRFPWTQAFCYDPPQLTVSLWRKLILIGLINVITQSLFAGIYYFLYPAIGMLISSVNLIFAVLFSFVLLRDERASIRSFKFLFGSAFAMCGVITVVFLRDPHLLEHLDVTEARFWIGVTLALLYAAGQAFYLITIRSVVVNMHPLASATYAISLTAAGLLVLLVINGGIGELLHQPFWLIPFMALTALLFIVLAHGTVFAALRQLNASVSSATMQLTPAVTCLFSALVYGDVLTIPQMFGGIAVLFGAWLASQSQKNLIKK